MFGLVRGLACAPASSLARPPVSAQLLVQNDHWLDQVVYAVCGGGRIRAGVARGLATTRLKLPPTCVHLGSAAFVTDPIGSSALSRSEAIPVEDGAALILHIPCVSNGLVWVSR